MEAADDRTMATPCTRYNVCSLPRQLGHRTPGGQLTSDIHLLATRRCDIHLQRGQPEQPPHARQFANRPQVARLLLNKTRFPLLHVVQRE